MNDQAVSSNCPYRAPSPHNCLGLMILVCVLGFSDALFHLCHLVLHQLKVLAVFDQCFGTLGPASDSHRRPDWGGSSLGPPPSGILSCPHVNPFQPDPPQRLPHSHPHPHPHPTWPCKWERATNWISWFHWEAPHHQRSSPPILQISSAAYTPMRLRRMSSSALTGIMTVDACCNFWLPLQVCLHSCHVLFLRWCDHPDSGAGVFTLSDSFPHR